jgi:hypothetical protein
VSTVWKQDWETLAAGRGNGALPAAWYLARNFTGVRLAELGSGAGDVAYSAASMAITRFEKRLAHDPRPTTSNQSRTGNFGALMGSLGRLSIAQQR